jgi:hypothetical protein
VVLKVMRVHRKSPDWLEVPDQAVPNLTHEIEKTLFGIRSATKMTVFYVSSGDGGLPPGGTMAGFSRDEPAFPPGKGKWLIYAGRYERLENGDRLVFYQAGSDNSGDVTREDCLKGYASSGPPGSQPK